MRKRYCIHSQRAAIRRNHSSIFSDVMRYSSYFLSFVFLLSVFLASTSAFAAKNVNNIYGEVNIGSSLNVTIPTNLVSLQLNPLNTDFGTADLGVTISTNNISGYTLTMSPTVVNQTSLARVGGTETIPTLAEKTGGYTESEFTTNSWGYKLSSTNYLSFNNSNEVAATNTTSNADTSTVTFAAKADNTQAAGTYQLEIAFTAIANPLPEPTGIPGKIRYDANSGTVIGQMGTQSAADGNTVTLYVPNFKNPGYGFAGWNTQADGSGDKLGPNEDYLVPANTTANGEVLYAMWVKSEGTLQDWTGCSTLDKGDVTALTDNRDGNTYAVAKLADDKCWMIENLRLDDSVELSIAGTNNPSLPLTNSYDLGTTSNHLSPTTDPFQTAWCNANTVACNDQSITATNNTTLFINNTSSSYSASGNVYSYGNYYNWYSATGGRGKNGTITNNSSASGDICPSGWHLPVGGDKNNSTNSDFWNLSTAIIKAEPTNTSSTTYPYYTGTPEGIDASKAMRTYPNNFVYSGYVTRTYVSGRNAYSYYWSSATGGSSYVYRLDISTNTVYPGSYRGTKYDGRPMRCVIGSSEPYAVPGYITYDPNANDTIGEMGAQSVSNGSSVTLYAPNYKRTGYGFAGWNPRVDGTGMFYGPNQTYTAPSDFSTTGLMLYAIWVQSAGTFQDPATVASVCNGLTKAPTDGTADLTSVSALTDIRDGDTYAIAKLADNKCWMIENLRLDDSAELSATNTNKPLLPLVNTYHAVNPVTSNHLSFPTDPTQNAWCATDSEDCDDQSMLSVNNTTLFTSNPSSTQAGNIYSYGNYYNWYSATAGNGKHGTSTRGDNVTGDVCPAGWHLPSGSNETGDFGVLDIALGGNGAPATASTTPTGTERSSIYRSYPNNIIYGGQANGSSVGGRTTYGSYWTTTIYSANNAHCFEIYNQSLWPGTSTNAKYRGKSIRCLIGGS